MKEISPRQYNWIFFFKTHEEKRTFYKQLGGGQTYNYRAAKIIIIADFLFPKHKMQATSLLKENVPS